MKSSQVLPSGSFCYQNNYIDPFGQGFTTLKAIIHQGSSLVLGKKGVPCHVQLEFFLETPAEVNQHLQRMLKDM